MEFDVDEATLFAFDRAYINSHPPAVRELMKGWAHDKNADGSDVARLQDGERYALALKLAPTYDIDWWIMALGGDPYLTMMERQMGGVQVLSYVRNRPMKVSINPADFPPFPDLVPAPTPAPGSQPLVGALAYADVYFSTQHAINLAKAGTLPNGTVVTQDGATYRFAISQGLMGASYTWVKQ